MIFNTDQYTKINGYWVKIKTYWLIEGREIKRIK